MKILQRLVIGHNTLIFTEKPEQDIEQVVRIYQDENRDGYMGYELPILVDFKILGTTYRAISFWHENEVSRDIECLPTT